MKTRRSDSPSVIVIGGGLAGIAAARALHDASFRVVLLESRERIGGRICTDYSFGFPVDLGASWLHGVCKENPLASVIGRLGLPLYRTSGDNSVLYDHDLESYALFDTDGNQVPHELVSQVGETFEFILEETNKVREEFSEDTSLRHAMSIVFERNPKLRLDGLAHKVLQWYLCRMEGWFSADADTISIKCWDKEVLLPGGHGLMVRGYQPVINTLAKGLDIYLDHRVKKITRRTNGVMVTVENGKTFFADAAIVAVPLGVLKSKTISFEPRLPEWKEEAIADLGVGIENKIALHFERVFWPNVEFLGVVSETSHGCSYFLNLHKATGHAVLVYMPAGQLAKDIEKMSDEAAASFAFSQLKNILPDASDPIQYLVSHWGSDKNSLGSYSYNIVGKPHELYEKLRIPVDNLFFAGEPFSLISAKPPPSHHHHLTTTNPTITTTTVTTPPTTYFEVNKPIQVPNTTPCSTLILHHNFAYTYGSPPVTTPYSPPSNCPSSHFSNIILQFSATCQGRQFDRIFGVWLGGVELLRSCTAEPRSTGIEWTVKKDITKYYSLLMTNQTLAVYLGNIVDSTYTGIYHVNITFHFYPYENKITSKMSKNELKKHALGNQWADLIIPISRNMPGNDGLWLEIKNSTDVKAKEFRLPLNAYRAVLEVYVSFHENDEFWPTNLFNEYVLDNNLTGYPGNGPFREVVVSLDGRVVGAVWPFTVVYTGGVNPLLWRPITGIGSFDLPTYDIEITPFLGSVLDGKFHEFGFSVTNALNVWYIDANLHVWLDEKSEKTSGKFLTQNVSPLHVSLVSNFTGLNGTFVTKVTRSIKSTGWIQSSYGKIVTESTQDFNYSNIMVMAENGDSQIVNQNIDFNDSVYAKKASSVVSKVSLKSFSFYIHTDTEDKGNGSYAELANITLGFNEKKIDDSGSKSSTSVLGNVQNGQGSMFVKGNLVVSGLGSTQQRYHYADDELCYFRDVSSSNYTIIYDKEGYTCSKSEKSRFSFVTGKHWPFPAGDRHAI